MFVSIEWDSHASRNNVLASKAPKTCDKTRAFLVTGRFSKQPEI